MRASAHAAAPGRGRRPRERRTCRVRATRQPYLPPCVAVVFSADGPKASQSSWFVAEGGERTAYFFFDLKEPSTIPSAAEPFFMNLHASIDMTPAMNFEDVTAGVDAALKAL